MKNENKNVNGTEQQEETKEKKPNIFKRTAAKHPKITKGVVTTAKVFTVLLAGVGGYGLKLAIDDQKEKKASSRPAPAAPVSTASTDDK